MIILNRKSRSKDITNIKNEKIGVIDENWTYKYNPIETLHRYFLCDLNNKPIKERLNHLTKLNVFK